MQVGDLIKHKGASGWWMMKDKIGVLLERVEDNGMVKTGRHRWLVQWCAADMPRWYREQVYWPEHLEVLCKQVTW